MSPKVPEKTLTLSPLDTSINSIWSTLSRRVWQCTPKRCLRRRYAHDTIETVFDFLNGFTEPSCLMRAKQNAPVQRTPWHGRICRGRRNCHSHKRGWVALAQAASRARRYQVHCFIVPVHVWQCHVQYAVLSTYITVDAPTIHVVVLGIFQLRTPPPV